MERARSVSARQGLRKESKRAMTLSPLPVSPGGMESLSPRCPPASTRAAPMSALPVGSPTSQPPARVLISCQTLLSRRLRIAPHFPRVKYTSPSKAVFGANAAPLGPLWSLLLLGPGEPLGLGASGRGWADRVRSSAPRGIADPPRGLPSQPERAWALRNDFPALPLDGTRAAIGAPDHSSGEPWSRLRPD